MRKATLVALYKRTENQKVAGSLGSVAIDSKGKIKKFVEKKDSNTKLIATSMYAMPDKSMKKIHDYLEGGNNPESPEYFIQWRSGQESVCCYILPGMWWDLGIVESYNAVESFYELTQ